MYIYTKYITLKNGKRLYAKDCNKKVFCFWVDDDKDVDKKEKSDNKDSK